MISALQDFSVFAAIKLALLIAVSGGLVVLFRPLLLGLVRAAVLVVRPKMTREQRRQLATRA